MRKLTGLPTEQRTSADIDKRWGVLIDYVNQFAQNVESKAYAVVMFNTFQTAKNHLLDLQEVELPNKPAEDQDDEDNQEAIVDSEEPVTKTTRGIRHKIKKINNQNKYARYLNPEEQETPAEDEAEQKEIATTKTIQKKKKKKKRRVLNTNIY